MFGNKVVLSKKHAIATRIALDGVEVALLERVWWKEVTVKLLSLREPSRDGWRPQPVAVKGRVVRKDGLSMEVHATIQLLLDPVSGFEVAEAGHELLISDLGDKQYRLRWTKEKTEIQLTSNWVGGPWRTSDDLKHLEDLPVPEVHTRLYEVRIRTLGDLKQWTRGALLSASKDLQVVKGAAEILAHYGCTFKPE